MTFSSLREAAPSAFRSLIHLGNRMPILIALVVAQVSLFLMYYEQRIGPFPPTGEVQSRLLADIYRLSTLSQTAGLTTAWGAAWQSFDAKTPMRVVGSLLDIYGGGGRLPLLLPNLITSIALEAMLMAAILRATGRTGMAAAAVGLLLLSNRPWMPEAGLYDVGPHAILFGVVGIVVCQLSYRPGRLQPAVLLSSMAIGALSLVDGWGSFGCILAICGLRLLLDPVRGRVLAWTVSAAIVLIAAAVCIAAAPDCGPDTLTATTLPSAIAPHCTARIITSINAEVSYGLGLRFVVTAIAFLAGAFVLTRNNYGKPTHEVHILAGRGAAFLVLVCCGFLAIQLLRRSIDPIGFGLLDIPLLMIVIALPNLMSWRSRRFSVTGGGMGRGDRALCATFLVLGIAIQCSRVAFGPLAWSASLSEGYAQMFGWIARDAITYERSRVRVLFLPENPGFGPNSMTAFIYELYGMIVDVDVSPPGTTADDTAGVSGPDYTIWMDRLAAGEAPAAETSVLDRIRATAVKRLQVPVGVGTIQLFSQPEILISGVSGGWLTAEGTDLELNPNDVPENAVIRLSGLDSYARYVPEAPDVTAFVDSSRITLPVRFTRDPAEYSIEIDPSLLRDSHGDRATVHLSFSRFFVPKDIGMNPDPRHLVVLAPTSIRFVEKSAPQP